MAVDAFPLQWQGRVDVDPTNDYLLGRSEMLAECAKKLKETDGY